MDIKRELKMKKINKILMAILLLFLLFTDVQAKTASEVFKSVSLSVVVILTLDAGGKVTGLGSGAVLPDSPIATNFHVVKDAVTIKVNYQKKEYPATLRHSDWDRDVCTLVVNWPKAPVVEVGTTKRLTVGARVYAIGTPQGLDLTLSEGIILIRQLNT
jgi:S1-C subfamily serine protease